MTAHITKDILQTIFEQAPKPAPPEEANTPPQEAAQKIPASEEVNTPPQDATSKASTLEEAKTRPQETAPKSPPPDEPKTPPRKASVFEIQLLDENGDRIEADASGCYNPASPQARRLMFSIAPTDTEPTVQQMEFCRSLENYEHAIRERYLEGKNPNELKFRARFVDVFYLSQLILEGHVAVVEADGKKKKTAGKTLVPDVAKEEIELLNQALIDDEAPGVKNQHLKDLAIEAMKFAPFFLVAYVALRLLVSTSFADTLGALDILPKVASNFMVLWVGTFVGVVLSYAIRTHQFTLTDLTRTDADYFSPRNRLLLAGAFATVLAYFAMVGLGELKIGELSLMKIAIDPMVALVAGVIFGIFEYKLTATVEKRAGSMYPADSK